MTWNFQLFLFYPENPPRAPISTLKSFTLWLQIHRDIRIQASKDSSYDVVSQEIGTSGGAPPPRAGVWGAPAGQWRCCGGAGPPGAGPGSR
jgi:hypothetical protein